MPDHEPDERSERNPELALLAHEVRGALTVISGLSELLKRALDESERESAIDGIARAVRRIDTLIAQALDGTLTSGSGHERVDLAALTGRVIDEQRSVSGRDITFEVRAQPVVLGAPEALERALGNLIDNALKYSLMTSPVDVSVTQDGDRAILAVADRGPGIPPSMHDLIFQPFERASAQDVPGTGLGLTVVRGVAESHGGTASVQDRPHGGSVFRVELPVAP